MNKGHLTFKYQMGEVHCREPEPDHVTKTVCFEELRTCCETYRICRLNESFCLLGR